MAENMRNAEPGTSTGQTTDNYHYEPKRFFSLAEIRKLLSDDGKIGERMRKYLKNVDRHHFKHMQVPIPVYNVMHVATKIALDGILDKEGFKILDDTDRKEKSKCTPKTSPDFQELLYWSVDITSEDLEKARQQAYDKASDNVIVPEGAEREFREQFGNSPAFRKSVSRFGNFKFSFPLCDLLSWYKDQHCGDGEPQMKILGTELFKLEIAHYIVVHSPTTDKFDDFPEVPTVQGSSDPQPFVYWMDGALYWRPESTSDKLKVTVSEDRVFSKEYGNIYSVWNYLILAFHLPNGHLEIPKELLIKNLTACGADKIYLKENPLQIEEAEEIIQELREVENRTCSK